MQIVSNIFPRKSPHCKLDPVQYREHEYGLIIEGNGKFLRLSMYSVDRIRILGIQVELACTRGLCGGIFSHANSF